MLVCCVTIVTHKVLDLYVFLLVRRCVSLEDHWVGDFVVLVVWLLSVR